jgi:hypothetical protein
MLNDFGTRTCKTIDIITFDVVRFDFVYVFKREVHLQLTTRIVVFALYRRIRFIAIYALRFFVTFGQDGKHSGV